MEINDVQTRLVDAEDDTDECQYSGYSFELIYEPEHWNQNCGCMIPEAWVAHVFSPEGDPMPKWPCGDTREEALRNIQNEFPGAIGS